MLHCASPAAGVTTVIRFGQRVKRHSKTTSFSILSVTLLIRLCNQDSATVWNTPRQRKYIVEPSDTVASSNCGELYVYAHGDNSDPYVNIIGAYLSPLLGRWIKPRFELIV